jgi:hypothetical protein
MKKIAILLICVSLVLCPVIFASCGDAQDAGISQGDAPAAGGEAGGGNEEPEPEEEVKLLPDLPDDLNFGEYKFRILFRSLEENEVLAVRDIFAEEINAEPINDAVFVRNAYLEEKYNFEIVGIPSDSTSATAGPLRRIIQADSDEYDAIVMRQSEVGSLITAGALTDYNDIPWIDFDKPWWDKSLTEQLSLGGKKFATVGDLISSNSNALRVIFFNKSMITDFDLGSPYAMVKENRWTLDAFYEMCKDISRDLNGDGIMDQHDQYGFLVQGGSTNNLFFGAGGRVTEKDENDIPIPAVFTEKMHQTLQSLTNILASRDNVMFDGDYAGLDPRGSEYVLMTTFEDGRGLFFGEILQLAERMRATDTEFGILPPPKADEHQENYMAFADSWCLNLLIIPITNRNLEMTGQILEAMAAESRYTVLPAYYEKTLKGKYARDEESAEMLDIIIQNKVISLDEMFGWGMYGAIQDVLFRRSGDFTSAIDRASGRHQTNIDRTMERIDEAG